MNRPSMNRPSAYIVPTSRMLFLTGLIFVPSAALASAAPGLSLIFLTIICLFLIPVLWDVPASLNMLDGIRIECPDKTRLTLGKDGELSFHIRNHNAVCGRLRIGLGFPVHLESPRSDLSIRLDDETPLLSAVWPCIARKTGRYILDTCRLETSSRLGFWSIRTPRSMSAEIWVYPDLMSEGQELASLFLNRNIGIHTRRQVGKGREFEQLRDYIPGDSIEDIHWKATARRGYPVTKIYQVERTQRIYVIIDASRLSARHPGNRKNRADLQDSGVAILDRYISAALMTGLAAERQGDHFGILTFSRKVGAFVPAKNGKAHYGVCRDVLCGLEPEPVTPDFTELFTFIGTRIRRRALLIFLTHMDDPVLAENFIRRVDMLTGTHLALVNMIRPPRAEPMFTGAPASSKDELSAALGGHLVWQHLKQSEKILGSKGIGFSLMDTEKICVQAVSQYMNIKQRQIL